jgi:GAF domain-containing protein
MPVYDEQMMLDREKLLAEVNLIVTSSADRRASMQALADLLMSSGNYRWVGLYEVDHVTATVNNIVWSGPGAPEYPTFPLSKGLTGSAIANRTTVNVGDVANDPRYIAAFVSTRSEIIVPVFDEAQASVVGTIDVESEEPNFFAQEVQQILETCAATARPLWQN